MLETQMPSAMCINFADTFTTYLFYVASFPAGLLIDTAFGTYRGWANSKKAPEDLFPAVPDLPLHPDFVLGGQRNRK